MGASSQQSAVSGLNSNGRRHRPIRQPAPPAKPWHGLRGTAPIADHDPSHVPQRLFLDQLPRPSAHTRQTACNTRACASTNASTDCILIAPHRSALRRHSFPFGIGRAARCAATPLPGVSTDLASTKHLDQPQTIAAPSRCTAKRLSPQIEGNTQHQRLQRVTVTALHVTRQPSHKHHCHLASPRPDTTVRPPPHRMLLGCLASLVDSAYLSESLTI